MHRSNYVHLRIHFIGPDSDIFISYYYSLLIYWDLCSSKILGFVGKLRRRPESERFFDWQRRPEENMESVSYCLARPYSGNALRNSARDVTGLLHT